MEKLGKDNLMLLLHVPFVSLVIIVVLLKKQHKDHASAESVRAQQVNLDMYTKQTVKVQNVKRWKKP